MNITVVSLFEPLTDPDGIYINTTSRSVTEWTRQLSPFYLGPCNLYEDFVAKKMENAWQYCKVYDCHVDDEDDPNEKYFEWAFKGWNKDLAVRYPMGKGAVPKYVYFDHEKYTYIEARQHVYIPLYARAVLKTDAYQRLKSLAESGKNIYLMDFDAYKHRDFNMTLTQVMNNPNKKMGHAFVLMMLLTNDDVLKNITI